MTLKNRDRLHLVIYVLTATAIGGLFGAVAGLLAFAACMFGRLYADKSRAFEALRERHFCVELELIEAEGDIAYRDDAIDWLRARRADADVEIAQLHIAQMDGDLHAQALSREIAALLNELVRAIGREQSLTRTVHAYRVDRAELAVVIEDLRSRKGAVIDEYFRLSDAYDDLDHLHRAATTALRQISGAYLHLEWEREMASDAADDAERRAKRNAAMAELYKQHLADVAHALAKLERQYDELEATNADLLGRLTDAEMNVSLRERQILDATRAIRQRDELLAQNKLYQLPVGSNN